MGIPEGLVRMSWMVTIMEVALCGRHQVVEGGVRGMGLVEGGGGRVSGGGRGGVGGTGRVGLGGGGEVEEGEGGGEVEWGGGREGRLTFRR